MKLLFVILALALVGPHASTGAPAPKAATVDASAAASAASATNTLGFDFYNQARRGRNNVILSPASLSFALAMVSAGARGQTQAQILSALHVDPGNGEIHHWFGGLLRALNGRDGKDGLMLHVADTLWAQQGFALEASFQSLLNQQYGAVMQQVDFANRARQASRTINAWAAKETHDRITDIVTPADLTPDTRLVVTNAVYFKGQWKDPFAPRATRELPFTTPAGKVKAQLMHQVGRFRYGRHDDLQMVELAYEAGLAMLVVLPDSVDGLSATEARFVRDHGTYNSWITEMQPRKVDLQLPRWKARATLDLNSTLQVLGVHDAFDDRKANFTGMAKVPLKISKVVQESFVEVNETGTEAAAVTAVIQPQVLSAPGEAESPIRFHADHPFLYIIRDTTTGAILFMGRVVDPTI